MVRRQASVSDRMTLVGMRGNRGDIELLTYLVPVLADLDKLTMELWFLSGVDQVLLDGYFSGEERELTGKDLLFLSDPSRTGYSEHIAFLEYLRDFIMNSPSTLRWKISGINESEEDESHLFFRYISQEIYLSDNSLANGFKVFIHNPVLDSKGRVELPFRGALYYMLIHEWPLYQYSGIPLKNTPFGELYLTRNSSAMNHKVLNEFDALILMGREEWLFPLNPIQKFINESNTPQALESFPDQIIREKVKPASYLMNLRLKRDQKRIQKNLAKIQQFLLKVIRPENKR